ncbi:protein GDAP2 homolog [Saccoglossus kowalevskii]|uniref:Protein GDAP2 homolog n=1 Tax=Saccoglossus kowalevskii TaxID=10224 RepID=A0ABM0GNI0_SACKO|nr:PREDICTED: protein GDAP2 homolog [Saccoglossus kowalevskii]
MDDPLGAKLDIVDTYSLTRWSDTEVPGYPAFRKTAGDQEEGEQNSRFPVRVDVNSKVILWAGDITDINTTAIVHATNEALNDRNPISDRIFEKAGPGLRQECRKNIKTCRTGEVKVTKGYNLPSRYVIHTVGPRYNLKYKTAAETALYSCYRKVLQISREENMLSVALSVINSVRRGYPPEEGAHIAIRTVRRFLEKYGETFDVIVFVVSEIDEEIYKQQLPVYFPRSKEEERWAFDKIPEDIGNEDGEPIIKERQIRIMTNPARPDEDEDEDDGYLLPDAHEDMEVEISGVGKHSFASMEEDPDKDRRDKLQTIQHQERFFVSQQRRYERWLKRARQTDLTEIAALRCLYQSGVDYLGRPVIFFVGRNFSANTVDLDKAVLYLIQVMDTIVNRDYVVVYFHTLSTPNNHPELAWIKQVYNLLDYKWKKNLRTFYIVHPTLWSRVLTWFFTTFTASSIKHKIVNLGGVKQLYNLVPPEHLDIPPFVLEYDMKVNGPDYYISASDDRSKDGL